MDYIQAIFLSIVEGISEFLPISSTGHLILASKLFNIPQTEFVKSFEIIIQLGAILAIVFLYFQTIINNFETWKRVLVAFIPSGVIGFLTYRFVKTFLIGNLNIVIISLLVGGIVILVFEELSKSWSIGSYWNCSVGCYDSRNFQSDGNDFCRAWYGFKQAKRR